MFMKVKLTITESRCRSGHFKAGEDAQQRGFSRAGGTHQAGDAGMQCERKICKHLMIVIALADVG